MKRCREFFFNHLGWVLLCCCFNVPCACHKLGSLVSFSVSVTVDCAGLHPPLVNFFFHHLSDCWARPIVGLYLPPAAKRVNCTCLLAGSCQLPWPPLPLAKPLGRASRVGVCSLSVCSCLLPASSVVTHRAQCQYVHHCASFEPASGPLPPPSLTSLPSTITVFAVCACLWPASSSLALLA